MSMVERTRVKCDARGCEKRTYVATRPEPTEVLRSCLNPKGWALVDIGKLRRTLCPDHVKVAEDVFAVDFVPKPIKPPMAPDLFRFSPLGDTIFGKESA